MTKELVKSLLDYLAEHQGNPESPFHVRGWFEQASDAMHRRERLNVWLSLVSESRYERAGEYLSTAELASFMAKIGALGGGTAVLDPACGVGLLLSLAAAGLNASVVHGIEFNSDVARIAELLLPAHATVFNGNSLTTEFPLQDRYDLIISEPPFGYRLRTAYFPENGGVALTDGGDALLCSAASKLAENGRAVFLVSASCLGPRGDHMWKNIAAEGVHVRALVHVPSGHLKTTAIESYIAVLDRTPREMIFTAQFGTDSELQSQIFGNFKAHRAGKRPAQGRLAELSKFQGFKPIEAKELLQEMAKRKGLNAVPMQQLVKTHQILKGSSAAVVDGANDLYLPMTGRIEAVLHPDAIKVKSANVIRLVLNAELGDARFVTASLNREIGRLFIETVCGPSALIKQIHTALLLQGTFYLPSIKLQNQALEIMSGLNGLRAELTEIESDVWENSKPLEKLNQKLRRVNHEDTLENWMEGLPFPLASILWRYRASNASTKEKSEILLHYFEALAEFWATVYLSAAKSDSEFWIEHATALDDTLKRGNLSFKAATFGLWKCVIEFFSKQFRKLLNDDEDRCAAMFRTNSPAVLAMLFDRRLITVLQESNSIRNNHAHGGVTGIRDTETTHNKLNDLINQCRGIMGLTWEQYELVQPGECRFTGGMYKYKARRVPDPRKSVSFA